VLTYEPDSHRELSVEEEIALQRTQRKTEDFLSKLSDPSHPDHPDW